MGRASFVNAAVAACLLASSCGNGRTSIDGEVLPYVAQFVQAAAQRNISVSTSGLVVKLVDFELDPKEPATVGMCERPGPTVSIERDFWEKSSDTRRFIVVAHELGHCLFKFRGHVESELPHIMTPTLMKASHFNSDSERILDSFFKTVTR